MSNVVLPLVLWGSTPPTHCVSAVLMTTDEQLVVSGCNDGQICVWKVTNNWKVEPLMMLIGHSTAINCLTNVVYRDKQLLVSSSDSGEMRLWDLTDGRCLELRKSNNVHVGMQSHQLMHWPTPTIICNGFYADVLVMDALGLEIIVVLGSRLQSDWISACSVLRPVNTEADVVLAITNSGTVKMWTLTVPENVDFKQPLFENEARQIRCLNAQMLRCCAYNQRTVLIVCSKYWQIYDAGDFSLLCSESARRGERWLGGDFIAVDQVIVWSSEGVAYLYKLPVNLLRGKAVQSMQEETTDVRSAYYRKLSDPRSPKQLGPQAFTMLNYEIQKPLECTPVLTYVLCRRERECKLLIRGDCEGRIVVWTLPDVSDSNMQLVRQESFDHLPSTSPTSVSSLANTWEAYHPEGLLDQLMFVHGEQAKITSTLYIASLDVLVSGRDNGSILLMSVLDITMTQLFMSDKSLDNLQYQVLEGHRGRVNCLLHPASVHPRYEADILVTGSEDFTVRVWDMKRSCMLHTFCIQAGSILQLVVPPENCNARVLTCIGSVAADHSLALLSLKENKCLLLASNQIFPIATVKWRAADDFLLIGCSDGTLFVWQMETGHLDRVVHGVLAEEILSTSDEVTVINTSVSNPSISIGQALKRANLATFKNFAQQTLQKAQDVFQQQNQQLEMSHHPSLILQCNHLPFAVQSLKANSRDSDGHLLLFDPEAIIVELLREEYSNIPVAKLAALGFFINIPKDTTGLTDTQKKMADIISKVKDKAEQLQQGQKSPVTAKKGDSPKLPPARPPPPKVASQTVIPEEINSTLKITQVFLSAFHSWGFNPDQDRVCLNRLGLCKPRATLNFGLMSRNNHMALLMPGWYRLYCTDKPDIEAAQLAHWNVSRAMTTYHILGIAAVVNTMMSITSAEMSFKTKAKSDPDSNRMSQYKTSWSFMATQHLMLLSEQACTHFKAPEIEVLARHWQDRCLEVREASQVLLIEELKHLGIEGRKQLVDEWAPHLPNSSEGAPEQNADTVTYTNLDLTDTDYLDLNLRSDSTQGKQVELHRKQVTAIVIMGIIGAQFGSQMESGKEKTDVVEGFGLTNYSHAMNTSKALMGLLLQSKLSGAKPFTSIRRAAIDLLGRGFVVWEPFLDVSSVLLGLLSLASNGEQLVPSKTFGLPLVEEADACRTARQSLRLIAMARPQTFIITVTKEVARYHLLVQSTQNAGISTQLITSPLCKGKDELLKVVEKLMSDASTQGCCVDLLVEVIDIVVFALDTTALKTQTLKEIFPVITDYPMISYCPNTKRLCVGSKNGSVAFYDLKQNPKCQVLAGHSGPCLAVEFSPEGKYVATYCLKDKRVLLWQTVSTSLFNLGSQSIKCIKTFSAPEVQVAAGTSPLRIASLQWINQKSVRLRAINAVNEVYNV